jgi:hypothetical protein
MYALEPYPRRGAGLLLSHCAALCDERPAAYARLEAAIGGDLARLLVAALTPRQGTRGSSSP